MLAGDTPGKLLVVEDAVVGRKSEVVGGSGAETFALDWKLSEDSLLRGEAIEEAAFEITLEGG